MSFAIAREAIDVEALRRRLDDPRSGAAVLFEGRVRNHNEGREVLRLEYEVYEPLAVREGNTILAEAAAKWPLQGAVCVHRSGTLELTEPAVVVVTVSAHREEAFQAARYIIDEVKARLPIWKKEHYADGEAEWVNCLRCGHTQAESAALREVPLEDG